MKFKVYYHSHNKKEGFEDAIETYLKRFPWKIEFENYNNKKSSISELIIEIKSKYFTILLTENGKEYTSTDFTKHLQNISSTYGSRIAFLIGPAEGFTKEDISKANSTLSLGKMTYPHNLARLLLVEQMYRAWTILENKPYHK